MKLSASSPPDGTVRDWLDHWADVAGLETSHIFPVSGESLTWAELRGEAAEIAARLTALGIAKGESVAVCQPNSKNAVLVVMALFYGGFRATLLNLAAGAAALGHAIEHSECRYVILDHQAEDVLTAALSETSARPDIISVNGAIELPEMTAPLHDVSKDDHALLMYTSGTTGLPKGVVHTQASLLAGGWTTAVAHALTPDDRALCVLPLYHINGLCVTLIAPLVSGGSVIVSPKFSRSRFWDDCQVFEATWFSVVPTIISHLLHDSITPDVATTKRLRFGRSASAPLSAEMQRAFEDRFGIPIVETMGLTETAAQILSNPLPPGLRKIGSPGIAFGNDVALINGGHICQAGETGEIAVRGANVMSLYFRNEKATLETFTTDGWMLTGDLGHMDEDGYVFVTGRRKELIIKGGENIAPREIDDALYAHKDVVEAAAFARPCKTYGQRVEAAVALSNGSKATPDELVRLCQSKLGAFKAPDCIYILPELPKGPSGKIQRLKIEKMVSVTA